MSWIRGLRVFSVLSSSFGGFYLYESYHKSFLLSENSKNSSISPAISFDTIPGSEVSLHPNWIVIHGKVYDITSLLDEHPGGSGILNSFGGKDVSLEFEHLRHSEQAREILAGLQIGVLQGEVTNKSKKSRNVEMISECTCADSVLCSHSADLRKCVNSNKKKIVVIGAGICGTATSYFLSHLGHDVILVDRAPLVGGTALQSTAIMYIGPVIETKSTSNLSTWSGHVSYELMELIQKNWKNIDFTNRGTLGVITNPEIFESLKKKYAVGGPLYGSGGELVNTARMLELEPSLNPSILGATWHSKGACVDPFLVCEAYVDRALELGTKMHLNTEVVDISRKNQGGFTIQCKNTISHISTSFDADEVVLATGWLCSKLGAMLNHEVKVKGVHGQLFTTKIDSFKLNTNLFSWEGPHYWSTNKTHSQATLVPSSSDSYSRTTRHFYAVQTSNGTLKIGGDRIVLPDLNDLQGTVVESGIQETLKLATEIVPELKNCTMSGKWSGTMPFTPNQTPILGQLEDGLWVMAGSPFTKGPSYSLLVANAINSKMNLNLQFNKLLQQCNPKKL